MGSQPRGLYNFISELRKVGSKEEEVIRIDKELGNIRQKFSNSSSLTAYQKKKYVWKLCYIYMLGYEVDFGHVEFISLLGASLYSDKSVGYLVRLSSSSSSSSRGYISLYCSILLASCFIWSAALDSSDALLPHHISSLA